MARQARKAWGGQLYPVIKRGNGRREIFSNPGDELAFMQLLEEGRERTHLRQSRDGAVVGWPSG